MRKILDAIDKDDLKKLEGLAYRRAINLIFDQSTALFYAVSNKCRKEIIEVLCKFKYIDVNKGSNSGETPLSEAIRLNRADIIQLLCQDTRVCVFHKDWSTKEKLKEMFDSKVLYPLIVRLALEKEGSKVLDVSKCNKHGDSLLHMAVLADQPDAISYLCEQDKVDHKAINKEGKTAFDLLFPDGKDFKSRNYGSILKVACRIGGKEVVTRKDSQGRTVLHIAVLHGDVKAVKILHDDNKHDIDINAVDNERKTSLSLAIDRNMNDIAVFLISQPRININDYKKGIFLILKQIVLKKASANTKLGFILEEYLTDEAVPESKAEDLRSTIPHSLEKLFQKADDDTSILSDLRSKIEDIENCDGDVKTICNALLNVIVVGLQQYANHKRVRYLFFKGSVYKTFVQIFVDLDSRSSDRSGYLLTLLRILYISTQANIKCHFACDEKADIDSDMDKISDKYGVPDKDNCMCNEANESARYLKKTLGEKLYAAFKERIKKISELKMESCTEVNDHQLIAMGINDAYFKVKDKDGCSDAMEKTLTEATNRLSSLFRLNKMFHKCLCRGDFAFIFCFVGIIIHTSDVYSDAMFGFKTQNDFSERLGAMMLTLVFATLIHENIRSIASAYAADKELLCITLGKIDLSDEDFYNESELNYYNDHRPVFKWVGRFFWTFKVYRNSKILTKESIKPLLFNTLSLLMLRPVVDRLIVLTHSPGHLRAIYRQRSKQKSLNQYYMIMEQMPELLIQFYVFQIYFNNLRTTKDYKNFGCTEFHSFTYRAEYFECVENIWRLKICAPWWEIYSMLIPFIKIPNSLVSLEEMFRLLSPETPGMSAAASACLYVAYIFMIPSRLFLFAAVMHSATNHFYVMAYLGLITCVWLTNNVYATVKRQNKDARISDARASEDEKKEGGTVGYYIRTIWSLLLFTIRDVMVISLRSADAYLMPPSEVNYKTLRTWIRMLAISSYYFIEGVVGAVYVEHYYPCGRSTEIVKYQGWLYLTSLIISVTMISLLSFILQPTKMYKIPRQFPVRTALICSLGLLMWAVGVITFLLTTKNSATDVRLPLVITTMIILLLFLAVVVILRFFSEAKQDSHMATGTEGGNQSAAQKLRLPVFLGQRNTYKEIPSVEAEEIELAPAIHTSETV